MILQALTAYYEQLLKKGELSAPGWDSAFKVTFGLMLDDDGKLIDLIELREEQLRGKKKVLMPRSMCVPAHAGRSSGVSANFLCDNSSYLLGADAKGKPERSQKCFDACAQLHQQLLTDVDTPAARAILRFFEHWRPDEAQTHPMLMPYWEDIVGNANLLFYYDVAPTTEDDEICAAWQRYYSAADEDAVQGQCLITGEQDEIAVIHPLIKGVREAQSSGAALVSFNAPAFNSYGHEQGSNAPVGKYAAFAYTTALNTLLSDRAHCKVIGDTTVVCWAESAEEAYQDVGMLAMFDAPQESGITEQDIAAVLSHIAQGHKYDWKGIQLNPDEHFYFLGLAPNAARLSVRFFLQDSFGSFMKNINQHYSDTAIIRPAYDNREHLSMWWLLSETVNQSSRDKRSSPQMAGDVMRAVLTGCRYPATLLAGTQLRIRAEREITRGRAAIIKAYYLRAHNPCVSEEVLQMELNKNSMDIPYTLGRLFSVYEQIQKKVNSEIKATIKDKYFNSASATPSVIFPILGNLSEKHLRVLRRDNIRAAEKLEKKRDELSVIIGQSYPSRLSLPEQGSFQLGYYFENQEQYKKKEDREKEIDYVRGN